MIARYIPYSLPFVNPILTSRGAMAIKKGYYLIAQDGDSVGIGECSYIAGLSIDDMDSYEVMLKTICSSINRVASAYLETGIIDTDIVMRYPSIAFGLEMALMDMLYGGRREIIADSAFYHGNASIPINGLVWMGDEKYLYEQIEAKSSSGWRCIKMKVGAIDFDTELELIAALRAKYGANQIELRLDANGAFSPLEAMEKLKRLSEYDIHSIEQPIAAGQYVAMAGLCRDSPIPIALDEELIGYRGEKIKLLADLNPSYIILKPSLIGGMAVSEEWIAAAQQRGIGWWATSALESNIGLNAIAQWAWSYQPTMPQGLGTGGLYTQNVPSPLVAERGLLRYDKDRSWELSSIFDKL